MTILVLGDSIAVGVGSKIPGATTVAKEGASSSAILEMVPSEAFDAAVISAGINDPPGLALEAIRKAVQAKRVVWILPADMNSARAHVAAIAAEHGDLTVSYDVPGGTPSKTNFHPASYAVLARDVQTAISTVPEENGNMAIDPVAAQALTYYVGSLNLTPDVATGVVAVLYGGESKLNPGSQGVQSTEHGGVLNPNGAYGIASLNGDRQAALSAFATRLGLSVSALETQLHFAITEAANSYPAVWAAITNPATTWQEMIKIFVEKDEIPAHPAEEIARSAAYGPDFLAFAKTVMVHQPMTPVIPAAPTPLPASSSVAVADLVALLAEIVPVFAKVAELGPGASIFAALLQAILPRLAKSA